MTANNPKPKRLLKVKEQAERWNCSEKTIYRRIRSGKLRAIRDGGLIRIHPDDSDAYEIARRRN